MRAGNMTVGIDLCNIENLRIVNGYEVIKKEEQLSNPSSPEDNNHTDDQDSDKTQTNAQNSTKNKCGRPANPVPRHKRDSHIKAEYKRRDKIQKGFETLTCLVPELRETSSVKESKSALLFKTAEYIHRLKAECEAQSEAAALRQELEALGTEIHELQDKLPENGLPVVEKPLHHMDTLYDDYVRDETKKNWKFWLFSFFIRPLYKSYREETYGNNTPLQFAQAVKTWLQETLALANLRKGFFDTMRKISTQTSIMTTPEQLRQEAMSTFHSMTPLYVEPPQPPAGMKPPWTPTPLTPPLTPPNVSADKPRSRGSRSRSTTPPTGDVKQRKRSGNRSEAPCRSTEENNQAKKIRNPSMPLPQVVMSSELGLPSNRPQPAVSSTVSTFTTSVAPVLNTHPHSLIRAYTVRPSVMPNVFAQQSAGSSLGTSPPANLFTVTSTAMETDTRVSRLLSDTAPNHMVTTLITVLPHPGVASVSSTSNSLGAFTTASLATCPSNICSTLPSCTQVIASSTQTSTPDTTVNAVSAPTNVGMDVQSSPPLHHIDTVHSFIPIDHSVSIDSGSIPFEQTPISMGSFDATMLPDIPLLIDSAPFQTTEEFLDDLCAFSTTQSSDLPTFGCDSSCSNLHLDSTAKSQPFHSSMSEDSLDKLLVLDDIGSLITFLNQDDSNIDHTMDNGHS